MSIYWFVYLCIFDQICVKCVTLLVKPILFSIHEFITYFFIFLRIICFVNLIVIFFLSINFIISSVTYKYLILIFCFLLSNIFLIVLWTQLSAFPVANLHLTYFIKALKVTCLRNVRGCFTSYVIELMWPVSDDEEVKFTTFMDWTSVKCYQGGINSRAPGDAAWNSRMRGRGNSMIILPRSVCPLWR